MDVRRQRILLIICLIFTLSFVFTRIASGNSHHTVSRIKKTTLVRHIPNLPPANATLGVSARNPEGFAYSADNSQFGAIAALSIVNSTRRAGLLAAANITDIEITIPDQPVWTDHDVEMLRSVNNTKVSRGSALAWLGHLNILRWFLSTELESVLILEDDVDWDVRLRSAQIPKVASSMRHLTANSASRVAASLINNVKRSTITDRNVHPDEYWGPRDSWDLLYLGHCGDMLKPSQWNFRLPRTAFHDNTLPDIEDLHPFTRDFLKNINIPTQVRLLHKSMAPLCTFGFALTRSAARRMLYDIAPKESNGGTVAYDVRMLEACRDYGIRCFTANPELFHHMDTPSEIETIDKRLKKERKAREKAEKEAAKRKQEEEAANGGGGGDGGSSGGGANQASNNGDQNNQNNDQSQQQSPQAGDQGTQQSGNVNLQQQTPPQNMDQSQQNSPVAGSVGLVLDSPQAGAPAAVALEQQSAPEAAIGLLKFDKRDGVFDGGIAPPAPPSQERPPPEDGQSASQQQQAQASQGQASQGQASQGQASQGQTQQDTSSSQEASLQAGQAQSQNQALAVDQGSQNQGSSEQASSPSSGDQSAQQNSGSSPQDSNSQQQQQQQGSQQQDSAQQQQQQQQQPDQSQQQSQSQSQSQSQPQPELPPLPSPDPNAPVVNATSNPNGPGDEADKGKLAAGYGKDEEGRLQSPLAGRAPNIRCGARSRTFYTKDAKTLAFLREVVGRQGQCLRDVIEEDMARAPPKNDRRERSWPY